MRYATIELAVPFQGNRVIKVFASGVSTPVPVELEKLDGALSVIDSMTIRDSAPPGFSSKIPDYPTAPSIHFIAALLQYHNPKEGAPRPYRLACHHHSPKIPTVRLCLNEKLPTKPKIKKIVRNKLLRQGYTLIGRYYAVAPLTPVWVELFSKMSPVPLEVFCRNGCDVQSVIESCFEERFNITS